MSSGKRKKRNLKLEEISIDYIRKKIHDENYIPQDGDTISTGWFLEEATPEFLKIIKATKSTASEK